MARKVTRISASRWNTEPTRRPANKRPRARASFDGVQIPPVSPFPSSTFFYISQTPELPNSSFETPTYKIMSTSRGRGKAAAPPPAPKPPGLSPAGRGAGRGVKSTETSHGTKVPTIGPPNDPVLFTTRRSSSGGGGTVCYQYLKCSALR